MKNVLFVSIAFPPKSDPECLQTAKYYYYLQQLKDLNIEVVTSKTPTLFMPVDSKLDHYDVGWSQKIEIPIPENKYWNFIQRKLFKEGIDWPDSKKGFHKQWKKALQLLKTKPNVIYSRSYPLSSTLMAYKLQQELNIPWIIHLSDPWTYSPIHKFSEKQKAYHLEQETNCLKAATKVCFTSELTIALYKKHFPQFADKFEYFPNVYDPKDATPNPHVFKDKIRIVYTGGLVGKRNISYLLHSLELLSEQSSELVECFEFIFAGAMDRQSEALFAQNKFKNIKHLGMLSYEDALSLQRSADLLLVIDNPIEDPEKAVFFPSKILDYLLAERKIFAITTKGGMTNVVLNALGYESISHEDSDHLKSYLIQIAEAFDRKESSYFYQQQLPEIYAADYNTKRLKKLINEIT